MDRVFITQYMMPSCFVGSRSSFRDAKNNRVQPARHAFIACLFVIFYLTLGISPSLLVIVAGLLALLAGLGRLLIQRNFIVPGTCSR